MKILLAADGSAYTKKALAFLVNNEALLHNAELVVLHVQLPMPPRVRAFVAPELIAAYHEEEAAKVTVPIEAFLQRHPVRFRITSALGHVAEQVSEAARREGAHMIVMGTHGYGLLGRTVMGSVAQGVIARSDIPVLLVK